MKKTVSLLLSLSGILLWPVTASAQIPLFEWAANLQWVNPINASSVTTDSSGNVIATGTFIGWQDMDPGPAELMVQSAGVEDVFIMKLDPDGNLLWVKTLGTIYTEIPFSVVTDSLNNVYVSGEFDGTVDFDPGAGTANMTAAYFKRGFLVSLDPAGNFRWVVQVAEDYSNSFEQKNKIAYTDDGGILLSENFTATVDFDPGPGVFNLTASGTYSAYVWKLDLNGGLLWAKALVNGVNDTQGAEVNEAGDIFVTGRFTGTPDFDPGPGVTGPTSNGSMDAFVLKLDPDGNFGWVRSFGGSDFEHTYDIAADGDGNVYVSGYYEGATDLDPGPGQYTATALGDDDNFVLKLDAQGDFAWALTYPFEQFNYLPSVDTDAEGNVYIASNFKDTLDIAPGSAVNQIFPGPSNILINNVDFYFCKISPAGNVVWVKQLGGEAADYVYDIHVTPAGNVHLVGRYDETVDFNPGYGNAVYTSTGGEDAFNLKFVQCTQSAPVPDAAALSDTVAACAVAVLVPPTASEFCLGTIFGVSDVSFPVTAIGTTTITWTYDAGNGFVSTQTQLVTIVDTTAPQPTLNTLPDVTAVCSVTSLTPPPATDNCAGTVAVASNASFPILATTTVTWAYDDGHGNTATQQQNVVITPISNAVNQVNAITLTAAASGYTYQWLDCGNGNTPVSGATGQSFTATANGSYALQVSNGTCTVVSNCVTISDVGLPGADLQYLVKVYPNPATDLVTIVFTEPSLALRVYDARGKIVSEQTLYSGQQVSLQQVQSGVYFFDLRSGDGHAVKRVVKN